MSIDPDRGILGVTAGLDCTSKTWGDMVTIEALKGLVSAPFAHDLYVSFYK